MMNEPPTTQSEASPPSEKFSCKVHTIILDSDAKDQLQKEMLEGKEIDSPASGFSTSSSQSLSPLLATLRNYLAILLRGYLDIGTCLKWSSGVMEHRSEWVSHFDGALFTLGRSWYTDLEEEKEGVYFASAARSDALVEKCAPNLRNLMLRLFEKVLGDKRVKQREGWCGPGIHAIPPDGLVAQKGGEPHFDTEGFEREIAVDSRPPCITVVVMLQPAENSGGGLRVFDLLWDSVRSHGVDPEEIREAEEYHQLRHEDVIYECGDVLILDAYRLHQILPFSGKTTRISATAHAVWHEAEKHWLVWF